VIVAARRKLEKEREDLMRGIDICRMMKRRLKDAGLPGPFWPRSFRVATVTELLEQNVELEDVQHLAGHVDRRTTRLCGCQGMQIADRHKRTHDPAIQGILIVANHARGSRRTRIA
jgi:site-specific recombinase XerD